MKDNTGNKNSKNIILLTVCIGVVVIVSVFLCVFLLGNGTDKRDGEYVIWSDEYQVALSPEIHNSYYLLGSAVNTDGNRLSEYSERSVFELDFNDDDTFTIAYNGKLLGVTPGKNGVGYSDSCTSVTWTLIEVEDGLYYIRNVDENTYLKWFEHMNNWTTHPNIVDSNRDQFLICLKKVD